MTTVATTTAHTHQRLIEFSKTTLLKIFMFPYATVSEFYCSLVPHQHIFDHSLIGHFIGVDVESSGVSQVREAWESSRKAYSSDFFYLDPSIENLEPHLGDKCNTVDVVCCMQHLQMCFESEERVMTLLRNVSSLLKPGGYFFGITPDSSTIWAKYQKNVEASHSRSASMKPNNMTNCIRSESYIITFEVEEEKLAREAGLEYVEIQNLTEYYDDNRAQFASLISKFGPILVDPRGRLLPRSYDVLGLYTTFVFQKPDPDMAPPITTPVLPDGPHIFDEREWEGTSWGDDDDDDDYDDVNGRSEIPPGLGNITHEPGLLGPGPLDLRFPGTL